MSSAEVNQRPYALWRHPLQNATIRVDAVPLRGLAVRALRFADKTEASEVGGLLWGTIVSEAGSKTILVEQAEFIGADGNLFNTTETTLERLSAALARPRSNLQPLGYFRSAVHGDVFPREQDRLFIEKNLTGPDAFVLIIEPLMTGGCTAHFYFAHGGSLQMKASLLRVPFVTQNSFEHDAIETAHNPLVPAPQNKPMPPEDYHFAAGDDGFTPPASWSKGRTVFIVTLLLAMAGVSVYRLMYQHPSSSRVETRAGDTPIGLQVERRPDGQLDLNWNRNFAGSVKAHGAQLSITDGTYIRTLRLTEDQLLSGKLAYFPRSDDIRFRLEISVGGNRTIGESIRVVSPEVYASSFADGGAGPARARTETGAAYMSGRDIREPGALAATPLSNGAAIIKTDTPGTFILDSRPPASVPTDENSSKPSAMQRSPGNSIQPVAEPVITAIPPRINTQSARASTANLAAIATAQSLPPAPPPSSDLFPPKASGAEPSPGAPALPVKGAPVAVPPAPIYQVMPNTKPFGYSLVNNDMTIDIEVQIDENGVVRQASPAPGSGRGNMLTTQSLIAARRWRFKPAEVDGRKVPGTYVISFKFRRSP
jgi:protein TonB